MIRRLIFSAGTVAGLLLLDAARARADRLAELECDLDAERYTTETLTGALTNAMREGDGLRAELRGVTAELAEAEQRCNVLAHRVEEAESDVRAWRESAEGLARTLSRVADERDVARKWAGRWKRLAADLRNDRRAFEKRWRDAEGLLADAEAKAIRERDAAQAKLATLLRGEDATRAQEGES